MNIKLKHIFRIIALVLLVASVLTIVVFTGFTGDESNQTSQWLAKKIENFVGNHFKINRNDYFWRSTLNVILRKLGHFLEFTLLGMTASVFFILILKKKWISSISAFVLSSLMALSDEFRQFFVSGRNPQWFDVKLDILGSLFGIAVTFAIWAVYSQIMRYKARVKKLEDVINQHHLEEP